MTDVTPPQPTPEFLRASEAIGISFDPGDLEKLGGFLALLLDANTRFNLTAITDPIEAWMRHVLDSLTLVPYIVSLQHEGPHLGLHDRHDAEIHANDQKPDSGETVSLVRILDVGSGGGLPGIPLAIVLPGIQFTLLEATGKKARFLEEVAQRLKLRNVQVLNERAEIAGQDHKNFREHFDIVLARAVGRLPVLLELTVPFARVGGHVLAMKGEKAQEEVEASKQALHLLHAQVVETATLATGKLVIIEKRRATPRQYPRTPGEPNRSPLR